MKALFMTCLLAMAGVLNIAAQNMDFLPDTWVVTDAFEPTWEKINGLKFQPVEYKDAKGERPTLPQA